MLTSKERAELRSQATTLDTTLMVGKGGVTEAVIAEADNQPITNSRSLLELKSKELVMPSNHLILCRPLLLLPSIFPNL